MFDSSLGGVNDYLMFRLITDTAAARKQERRPSYAAANYGPRGSLAGITPLYQEDYEPFCSPVVPHVPIRQRLAYRRCTSVDANDIDPNGSMSSYGYPRRRKMSLLQSLRQQNKHLADSGLDVNRQRTDSESSPPQRPSPPNSPSKGALGALKSKTKALFGRKESRPLESRRTMHSIHTECSQTDPVINGRSRKSPSTTNDSGRGSQGHLDERVFERILERVEVHHQPRPVKKHSVIARTNSCPNIALPASRGAPLCNAESDDDILFADKNSSPVNSIDFQIERRLAKRALEIEHKLRLSANGHAHFNYAAHRQSNAV